MHKKNKKFNFKIITPFRITYLMFFMIFLYSVKFIDINNLYLYSKFSSININVGNYIQKIIVISVVGILSFSYISIKISNNDEKFCIEKNNIYLNEMIDIIFLSLIGIGFNFGLILKDDLSNYIYLKSILASINILCIFYKIFRVSIIKHYIVSQQNNENEASEKEYDIIFNRARKKQPIKDMKFVFEYYKKTS